LAGKGKKKLQRFREGTADHEKSALFIDRDELFERRSVNVQEGRSHWSFGLGEKPSFSKKTNSK